MSNRKKLQLNVRFSKGKVICAKSPIECRSCKDIKQCEKMDLFYYPFKDIIECFKNNQKKKVGGDNEKWLELQMKNK